MGEGKLLVVGIDPGTTTGYAILDLDRKLVALKSSKNLGLNALLEEVIKEGKVVSIGTDKAKVPSLVNLFSAKTGAKIFYPKEDLKVEEKRGMTEGFKTNDGHQIDALAASLFAFDKIKGILGRIDNYVKESNKQGIKNKIANFVLTKEVSIREAVDFIENKEKDEVRIIENVVERRELKQNDFMKLYPIVKRQQREAVLMSKQNKNLKEQIKSVERKYLILSMQKRNYVGDSKVQKNLLFKDKSISFLENKLDEKEREIKRLNENVKKLNSLLLRIQENAILKKLDNLGSYEFYKKIKILNINSGDILLVKNPNIISSEVINFLKDKVEIIIAEEPVSKKIIGEYNITFLDSKYFNIEHYENFALSPKAELERGLRSKTSLMSLIESYKQKRREEITSLSP